MKNNSKGSALKRQLYSSYLGLAAIGLIILLIATLVTSQLRTSSTKLIEQEIPETISWLKLQSSLQQALSSLRGWVAIQDPIIRQNNNRVWKDDIFPSIDQLEALVKAGKAHVDLQKLLKIKQKLADLHEWQWYIFEASNNEGNLPAFFHFQRYATPIYHNLQDNLNRLIHANNKNSNVASRATNLDIMLELSKDISDLQSMLAIYVQHGDKSEKQTVLNAEKKSKQLLTKLVTISEMNGQSFAKEVQQLNKIFNGYAVIIEQVVQTREKDNWHVANHWLKHDAMPLALSIQQDIDTLLKTQLNFMNNNSSHVQSISDRARWIFGLLLLLMICTAILIARYWTTKLMKPIQSLVLASNEFAHGNMDFKLNIDSQDEFGELAHSFDEMRQAVLTREQKVAASAVQLKTTIDTVVDALIVIDNLGIIESINPAGCKIFQYQEQQLLGKNVKTLMPQPYHGEHDGYLNNYRKTNVRKIIGQDREITACRANGDEFPAELSVNEMWVDGQQKFVGLVRDITERKRVEKAKSEFISVVSHELRTPLTSIRGSLGLLVGGVTGDLGAKANTMLDIAVRSTDRLIRLINDILDIEKMESGNVILKTKRFGVAEFLEQIIHSNEGMATSHQVKLTLGEVSPTLELDADADRINQVITNLLSNAIKYSPKGEAVQLDVEKKLDKLIFSISDKGPGIPDEFMSRIFQKFNQADSSATRAKGGTGLGLSIAKAIVEQHDGEIDFETSPQGSRFYFSLPAITEIENKVFTNINAMSQGEKARILICEDDPDIATLLSMITKEQHCDSEIVTSAEAAKKAIAERSFNALFLDLNLPGKSGVTLIKELRADEKTRKLPIIVISAIANEVQQQPELEVFHVLDWLEKPIDVESLVSTLNTLLLGESDNEVKILYVEDDVSLGLLLTEMLKDSATLQVETTCKAGLRAIEQDHFDLVILDIELPDGSGLDLIPSINALLPKPPPIMVFSAQEIPQEYSGIVSDSVVKANVNNESLVRSIKKQLSQVKKDK